MLESDVRSEATHGFPSVDESLRFERLLSDLSTGFITIPGAQIDTAIEDGLRRIVEFLGIDRCTLSQVSLDSGHFQSMHSWAASGLSPVPLSVTSRTYPWVLAMARAGKPVIFSRLDELPPEAAEDRQSYQLIGLRSHVALPVIVVGELVAVLGFGTLREERVWPEHLVQRLRLVAEIFASALARQAAEHRTRAAELQGEQDRAALHHMTRVSMLGQLSASIAHQLNQPLAAILGNAEAARKMLGRERVDLAELREICDDIVTEDNRAADVIRRLGALYKRGEMKLQPLDVNALVRETLDLLDTELLTRQVTTAIDLSPSLPMIDGGRVQLQQVLLNLILNASDAMSGTEKEDRKLTIRTDASGGEVRLHVIDRGSGIATDDLKNVFDAFWSTKPGGMGIGLAICQSIVVAHRGRITVVNNPEDGATFCVSLPIRQAS